ncbi:unnamed protein product [Peronospora belbahrii]|uniref:BZIP domain-containing protein n=1 Tax=Peronospora belbahrii TaxID=622444 RepID=A0AAU9L1K3_9STRA|nr:unnamed protein product [Peronospora belbahrii]CAH0517668.1 unnamed protein product [Peronospora belbahrii]
MHCHRSIRFQSELSSDHHSLDTPTHDAHLENEKLCQLVPITHYHLTPSSSSSSTLRRFNVKIRDLTNAVSPSSCHEQQGNQYLQDTERNGDSSDPSQDKVIFSTTATSCKRSKTNSERGRAFRARRKKYKDDLVTIVSSLRQEVSGLVFLRGIRAEKALHSRNTMCGSLVRLVREYFALFERGIPSVRGVGQKRSPLLMDGSTMNNTCDVFAAKQEAFLKSAMHPEMQFGQVTGPQNLLEQWKRYTNYHARFEVEVVSIKVSGDENDPIVTVYSNLSVVFSRATFDHVFPHVVVNEELLNRFIGRKIVYHAVNRLRFSPNGQIFVYESDVGFVASLVEAGASISDIALLMQQAKIADECRLGKEDEHSNGVQELEPDNLDTIMFYDHNVIHATHEKTTGADSNKDNIESSGSGAEEESLLETSGRFAIDFLLS